MLFRTPESALPNKFIRVVYLILFPIKSTYEKQSGLRTDIRTGCIWINGMKYSPDVFKWFSRAAKDGDVFMFVKRDKDTCTIKRLTQPIDAVKKN